jgi:hypothetical protein
LGFLKTTKAQSLTNVFRYFVPLRLYLFLFSYLLGAGTALFGPGLVPGLGAVFGGSTTTGFGFSQYISNTLTVVLLFN